MVQREHTLRDRRRGRLDPDRRGADAADHLRPRRGVDRQVLPVNRIIPGSTGRGDQGRRQQGDDRRLPGRREDATASLTEEGVAKVEKLLGVDEPLRPREHRHPARRQPGAARARALQARRRLHDQGRRGRHRRRVHRAADAGPALVRRPAPGGRGQGRRQDRAREPDARHHHLPELLPHVREARRHDRHRRHRGRRVRQDLQARRRRHPDEPADDPRSTSRTWSTARSGRSSTPSSTRSWSCHERGQPVLVGTVSIEKSEQLSSCSRGGRCRTSS